MPVQLKVCGMGTFSVKTVYKSIRSWTLGRSPLVQNFVEYPRVDPGYLSNLGSSGEFNVCHNMGLTGLVGNVYGTEGTNSTHFGRCPQPFNHGGYNFTENKFITKTRWFKRRFSAVLNSFTNYKIFNPPTQLQCNWVSSLSIVAQSFLAKEWKDCVTSIGFNSGHWSLTARRIHTVSFVYMFNTYIVALYQAVRQLSWTSC